MKIHEERAVVYQCDGCDDEVRVLNSDGDREDLTMWVEIIDCRTGNEVQVSCPECAKHDLGLD